MKKVVFVFAVTVFLTGCASQKCATDDEVMDAGKIVGIYAYQRAVLQTGRVSPETYILAKAIADSITMVEFKKARKSK